MTTTPLTSAEIREWAISHRFNLGEKHEEDFLEVISFEDLITYIDNEPKLRQIMGEEE